MLFHTPLVEEMFKVKPKLMGFTMGFTGIRGHTRSNQVWA
jgi:hypothetical protein